MFRPKQPRPQLEPALGVRRKRTVQVLALLLADGEMRKEIYPLWGQKSLLNNTIN